LAAWFKVTLLIASTKFYVCCHAEPG